MNDDSCLNYNPLHNIEKKSTSKDHSRIYHSDEQSNYYYKFLNEQNKKGSDTDASSSPFQNFAIEIRKLNEQIEVLIKERHGLRQQCKAAIQQWDKTLIENTEIKEQLVQLSQQRDEAHKKYNIEIQQRLKTMKDFARLSEERNSVVREIDLIMSERDTVHKEMEKLSEELAQNQKKIKSLEVDKKNLLDEVESLKKEILMNKIKSMDKEHLMKQMYKEKYNENFQYGSKSVYSNSNNKWGSSSSGFSSWTQFGVGNLKNPLSLSSTNSNINSLQTFSPIDTKQKQFSASNCSSVYTMGNNKSKSELSDYELDLRKQIQSLEFEHSNLHFEFKKCLQQNEKILQERESIKTLCDKLRRERDRAIRDRAEALEDLNDYKQKIESNAQIKKYMDDLNDMNNLTDNDKNRQTNNTSSKDSAISADIQDVQNDYETLNILLVNNFRHNNSFKNPWGFSIRTLDKNTVIVSGINLDSPAEDKLKLNDIILSINSISINDEQLCSELLSKFDKDLQLVIQRKKQLSSIFNINLDCCKNEHGIILENCFLIKKLLNDSVAAKNANISVGDRLLSINGHSLENSTIHDAMQLLREDKLLLKVYKQSLNNQNSLSSIVLSNNNCDQINQNQIDNQQQSNKYLNIQSKPTYHKDDLHLTTTKQQQSSYSPNIGHYQSIKRSSKKSKVLNDSSSSFGTENDKFSQTLLDKAYNKFFKKSVKSKSEKKEEKLKKSSFNSYEKETIDDFNKIINNLSNKDAKEKSSSSIKSNDKEQEKLGTWPSCKSNTNLLSSQTYGKVNPLSNTTYSKKKERKSLAIFTNYKNDSLGQTDCQQPNDKSFNNYPSYGIIQQSNSNTTVLENNSYKSLLHQTKNQNELRSLSSSISSYPSKENNCKSNNSKKYIFNHDEIYKSFNAPSNSSIQMDSDFRVKKLKEAIFLQDYIKPSSILNPQQTSFTDLQDQNDKNLKDNFHLSRGLTNSQFGFYSIKNKRQLITNNLSNYTHDLDSYYNNNNSVEGQGLTGSDCAVGPNLIDKNENNSLSNSYFNENLIINQDKKSSPININQFKVNLNRLSITPTSPSYMNEFSNSPSSFPHYATSNNKENNYYYVNHQKQNIYDRSNLLTSNDSSSNVYGYINQSNIPLHSHQSNNQVESFSSLSSNFYNQPDEFMVRGDKNNQRLYISSNNSVASKLSNNSIDSNSNAINNSSNYFSKKASTNESFDSVAYSNIQNLRNHVDLLNRKKNLSLDKKLISSNKMAANRKKTILSIDKESMNSKISSQEYGHKSKVLEQTKNKIVEQNLDNYSTSELQIKPGEIRSICIEKSKEKSLGIQIESGKENKINSGIFVSHVNEKSLAEKVGLKVGDQLLEICGINMRSANYDAAASVLRQCGQTVHMKVQYSPDKYFKETNSSQIIYESNCKDNKENLNNNQTIERETNLDKQENLEDLTKEEENEDCKKLELEDTLKNYQINLLKDNKSVKDSNDTMDNEEDSCLYF